MAVREYRLLTPLFFEFYIAQEANYLHLTKLNYLK